MGSELEACAECSRNCLLIHRKHDPSLIVCSFFKVMYGKHFADVVIVPPRFVRLTSSLVAQETCLEDSSGRKWNVILSDFNGSLAIQKGWNEFLVDHGIQLGDFVVFHYIMGSHFVVQTYGTHGCEKLSLSGENAYQNKRAKATEYTTDTFACAVSELEIDDIRRLDDIDDMKEPLVVTEGAPSQARTTDRPKGVSMSEFLDDTQFIINQDHFAKDDDRDYLFDLSVFEMPNKSVEANQTNKLQIQGYRCSQVFDALQKAEIGAASNSIGAKKCHAAEGNLLSSGRTPVVKQDSEVYSPDIRGDSSLGIIKQGPLSLNMMQKSVWIPQNSEFTAGSDYCQPPGAKEGLVKQKPQKFSQNFCGNAATDTSVGASWHNSDVSTSKEVKTNNGTIVKPEPLDFCDSSSAPVANLTCLVQTGSDSFLELPECLPLKMCGQAAKFQPKLVLLQDPAGRVWPVLYHQKYGVKVLASGWKAFREANNIQPGDECTFAVDDMDEGRFLVQIVRSERP